MNKQKITLAVLILVIVLFMAGMCMQACSTNGTAIIKSPLQMTSAEKSTWAMTLYNKEYKAYMTTMGYAKRVDGIPGWRKISDPNLTEKQREILQNKKEILIKAEKAIKAYNAFFLEGQTPTALVEEQLLEIIDRLAEY
jgi:hypothetical protein